MISEAQFDDRIAALWSSQKSIGREKKWKSGKRAGMVRKPAAQISFTREQLRDALWAKVGLSAIPCPYCSAPIDILSLTLDHIVPRSIGGEFSLANMQAICKECNERKGEMTHEAFTALLRFTLTLSRYDKDKLLSRLKASHHGSQQRFFRDRPPADTRASPPAAKQNDLGAF